MKIPLKFNPILPTYTIFDNEIFTHSSETNILHDFPFITFKCTHSWHRVSLRNPLINAGVEECTDRISFVIRYTRETGDAIEFAPKMLTYETSRLHKIKKIRINRIDSRVIPNSLNSWRNSRPRSKVLNKWRLCPRFAVSLHQFTEERSRTYSCYWPSPGVRISGNSVRLPETSISPIVM